MKENTEDRRKYRKKEGHRMENKKGKMKLKERH